MSWPTRIAVVASSRGVPANALRNKDGSLVLTNKTGSLILTGKAP